MREGLARLEHEQWVVWSKSVLKQLLEDVDPYDSVELRNRVLKLHQKWLPNQIDYDDLSEELKDKDREWADKVLKLIQKEEV